MFFCYILVVKASTKQTEAIKKKSNVAKKSTGGVPSANVSEAPKSGQWEAPWLRYQRKAPPGTQRPRSAVSFALETEKVPAKGEAKL